MYDGSEQAAPQFVHYSVIQRYIGARLPCLEQCLRRDHEDVGSEHGQQGRCNPESGEHAGDKVCVPRGRTFVYLQSDKLEKRDQEQYSNPFSEA
jgi:hypothetical protein